MNTKEYQKTYRLKNKKKISKRQSVWYLKNRERLIAKDKEYKLKNKERINEIRKFYPAYLRRKRVPLKDNARDKVYKAIKRKLIEKRCCEVCGKLKTQAHHQNYNFPLVVNWLCSFHHAELHRKILH